MSKYNTTKGRTARDAITRCTDVADLRQLIRHAEARARLVQERRAEKIARQAWDNLTPGRYKLCARWAMHSTLTPGVIYRLTPYRGHKHKGAHLVPVGKENPKHGDYLWLPMDRSNDIVRVADDAENDHDQVAQAEALSAEWKQMVGSVT